jgi:hypothetical protein
LSSSWTPGGTLASQFMNWSGKRAVTRISQRCRAKSHLKPTGSSNFGTSLSWARS